MIAVKKIKEKKNKTIDVEKEMVALPDTNCRQQQAKDYVKT